MHNVPALQELLVSGGDERIACDAQGRNKYGCFNTPQPDILSFSSSTATTISAAGFAASAHLYEMLAQAAGPDVYLEQEQRIKRELLTLCELESRKGLNVVLYASGTDIHRAVADSMREAHKALHIIMPQESETGSGVKAALGEGCIAVQCRLHDGSVRPAAELDAEVESLATRAIAAGQQVLIILTDVSKTGLIIPSVPCALALKNRFPAQVDIMVDGCQFRFCNSMLCYYLEQGCMVALTGSKFVTGPAFCGALLLAEPIGVRPEPPNYGMLLRWQAALTELSAFHALPEKQVAEFLHMFSNTIQDYLADNPVFHPVALPPLKRPHRKWDSIHTIFPFLLRHKTTGALFSNEKTIRLYKLLTAEHYMLGQPVAYGEHTSALRLNMDMRLIADALHGRGRDAVIDEALGLLDKTSFLAHRFSSAGVS